jgi:hypothetical protein
VKISLVCIAIRRQFFCPSLFPIAPSQERAEIARLRDHPLREGDTWYALSFRWWRQWSDFVDFGAVKTADQPGDPLEPNIGALSLDDDAAVGNGTPPGPIDNGDIAGANNVELRENIIEDVDYVLLPAAAYLRLSQWYPSATATNPSFPRTVISTGLGNAKTERVELYPFCVPIALANELTGEPGEVQYKLFSRQGAPTLQAIVDLYMQDVDTSAHTDETTVGRAHVRLWAPGAFVFAVLSKFAPYPSSSHSLLLYSSASFCICAQMREVWHS